MPLPETISVSVTTSAGTFPVGTEPITAGHAGTGGGRLSSTFLRPHPPNGIPGDDIDFSVVSTGTNVTYTWSRHA